MNGSTCILVLLALSGGVLGDKGEVWTLGETKCKHPGIFEHPTDCLIAFVCPGVGDFVIETYICRDKAIDDSYPVGCLDKCPSRPLRAPRRNRPSF